jgi:hypothetical protein
VFFHAERANNVGVALKQLTTIEVDMGGANAKKTMPFVNAGNRAVAVGPLFSPKLLRSNPSNATSAPLTWDQIASHIATPGPIQRGIICGANWLTAGICRLTNNRPASACANPTINSLESTVRVTP